MFRLLIAAVALGCSAATAIRNSTTMCYPSANAIQKRFLAIYCRRFLRKRGVMTHKLLLMAGLLVFLERGAALAQPTPAGELPPTPAGTPKSKPAFAETYPLGTPVAVLEKSPTVEPFTIFGQVGQHPKFVESLPAGRFFEDAIYLTEHEVLTAVTLLKEVEIGAAFASTKSLIRATELNSSYAVRTRTSGGCRRR